jgi:uncharacterized protein YeeX (DUF496 family)
MTEFLQIKNDKLDTKPKTDINIDTITITGTKYCCLLCKKSYSRKISLDKHKILCDFKSKSKLELQVEEEEFGDTPSHEQLVKIVQELTFKYIKLEEKMETLQKWVNQKKQKIKVIDWLNEHIEPTIGFKEWITTVQVMPEDALSLFENNIFQTFQLVIENNLKENNDFIYPIKCFSQKTNIFYICETVDENKCVWIQATTEQILLLLKKIQGKIITELTKWKLANKAQIDSNDKLSDQFNKAVIKLMSVNFTTHDVGASRIRNALYTFLKTDLKNLIEYEFEL